MKHISNASGAPKAVGPYSQATISNGVVYTAGQIALNEEGQLINASIAAETQQIMANLRAILTEAGATFDSVVQTTIFIADASLFPQVNDVYRTYFKVDYAPARTTVVANPPLPGAHVEISMIARISDKS